MEQTAVQRPRGRPRDEGKDAAIADATWQLLAERGFDGLTLEAVADLAGCSRSTLYRRHANKVELVEAVLNETARDVEPVTDACMSPREVLIAHCQALCRYLSGWRGPALMRLSGSARHHPELAVALERHSGGEQKFYLRELERVRGPGITDADRDFAYNSLVGAIIFHVTMLQAELSEARIAQLVDVALSMLKSPPR